MPTKHKRKRDPDDRSTHDLPPTAYARPLPVIAPTKQFLEPRKRQKLDKPRKRKGDDTPKAFARLMAWTQQGRKIGGGLDDGRSSKKQDKGKNKKTLGQSTVKDTAIGKTRDHEDQDNAGSHAKPKIRPGETLAQFAVRVDQSLPLSSIPQSGKGASSALPEDLREKEKKMRHLTKHNKRLARMQAEWRNTEAKLRSKEEEEAEDNEERIEEEQLMWDEVSRVKRRKKGTRIVDDDPWKVLEKKRGKQADSKRGLNASESVQQPPELKSIKNIFKVNGSDVLKRTMAPGTTSAVPRGRKRPRRDEELLDTRRAAIEAARRYGGSSVGLPIAV